MKIPKVYFFCCEEEDNFQSDLIPIAEGLQALGLPYFSRANYWRQSVAPDDFLFRATPEVNPEDCDVVVFPFNWFRWMKIDQPAAVRREFPALLTLKNRRFRTVFMDDLDGYETVSWEPAFRHFDLILRTKFNRRTLHPANVRPWAIGLSNRMLEATAHALPFAERKQAIFVSYNASHPYLHTSRTAALRQLHPRLEGVLPTYRPPFTDIGREPATPYEALMWRQTNYRHSGPYFERLGSVAACSAFCGEIVPGIPPRAQIWLHGGQKAKVIRALYRALAPLTGKHDRILSCDSFRFWETLAAGAVAFNVAFESYGVGVPVAPENGQHYIGVDFQDRRGLDALAGRIRDDPALLPRIGRQGRAWALQHYSPQAQALRLLALAGWDLPSPGAVDG